MSTLLTLNLELSKFKELTSEQIYEAKSGKKYVELVVAIADETNQFGQSVSAWVGQSKQEREAKAKKMYCANGKVLKTDGHVHLTEKPDNQNEMPF